MKDEFVKCDAVVISKEKVLDFLILDIEKLENRLGRTDDEKEKAVIKKCMANLEAEKPVCDLEFTEEERAIATLLAPLSLKGTVVLDDPNPDVNNVIKDALDKSGMSFFYTAGKPEVRSWFIKKGSTAVTCAGKIHTDLARGFIKADIVNIADFRNAHNLQDARTKGLVKLVDKDYVVQEGDIIEIRFNV